MKRGYVICPKCGGTGIVTLDSGKKARCNFCYSSGEVPKEKTNQTNEEYMQTCNSEELGCFICENFFHGACGECKFCEITELRHHCILGEWLKEKHKDA